MSTGRTMLPERTLTRLQEWLRQKQEIEALVNASLLAAREALAVPDDWLIRDVAEGFIAPPKGAAPDPEANTLREVVG